jgi:hypothetical protein
MIGVETFLATLYVMVDDFCNATWPLEVTHAGPRASLSRSEVVTLAVFGQWSRFESERAFYRYAERHLRWAFPSLPLFNPFGLHFYSNFLLLYYVHPKYNSAGITVFFITMQEA